MLLRSRRITTYVLRELSGPTVLGLTLYTFVLLMNHFFLVAEKALSKNLGTDLTLRLFVVGIPAILVLTIPMAVLLGSLIAVGRLSADHEWVALQSAGHGPSVLLRPILIHGLLATLAGFLIYGVILPQTNFILRNLKTEILYASNLAADLRPRVFYNLQDDAVMYVEEIRSGAQRRLENVYVIQSEPNGTATELHLARFGDLYPSADGSGTLILDLYDGWTHLYDPADSESYQYFHFDKTRRPLDPAAYLAGLRDNPLTKQIRDLNFVELWQEIQKSKKHAASLPPRDPGKPLRGDHLISERRLTGATVEFHQRLALPAASLFLAILALPLGITGVRSGKGAGFAMSILVIIVYRAAFLLGRDQATAGNFPAALGPWTGNAVILLWALYAYWRLYRSAERNVGVISRFFGLLRRCWDVLRRILTWKRADGSEEQEHEVELATLGGTPSRFIGRLDKYVGLAYLKVLFFALGSAYMVYGLVELQDLTDSVIRTGQSYSLLAGYFKYFAPTVLHIVLPVACLVGAVVAITTLSRNGELVAMQAGGIGMRRVVVPILILTLALCGGMFLVSDRIAPASAGRADEIRNQIKGKPARSYGLRAAGRWSFGPEGRRLYHYRMFDQQKEEFLGLSVFTVKRDEPRLLDHRFSERARWNGEAWEMDRGWSLDFDKPTIVPFEDRKDTALDPPASFASREIRLAAGGHDLPDQLSLASMREQIVSLRASGYDVTKLQVAYYGKFSQAFSPFVMVLLGLPFGFRVGRRGSLYGIGVALLLVLVYWAALAVFNALGLETVLRPLVAAWAPNAFFGLLGAYLMLYVRT